MKINYCGGAAQERMARNGWTMRLPNFGESPDELHARLSEKWDDVRVYWTGTMIRGIHNHFAFCKGRKQNGY